MPSFFVPVGYEKRRARLALFRTTILWPPPGFVTDDFAKSKKTLKIPLKLAQIDLLKQETNRQVTPPSGDDKNRRLNKRSS